MSTSSASILRWCVRSLFWQTAPFSVLVVVVDTLKSVHSHMLPGYLHSNAGCGVQSKGFCLHSLYGLHAVQRFYGHSLCLTRFCNVASSLVDVSFACKWLTASQSLRTWIQKYFPQNKTKNAGYRWFPSSSLQIWEGDKQGKATWTLTLHTTLQNNWNHPPMTMEGLQNDNRLGNKQHQLFQNETAKIQYSVFIIMLSITKVLRTTISPSSLYRFMLPTTHYKHTLATKYRAL